MEFTTIDIEAAKLLPKIEKTDGDGKKYLEVAPIKLTVSNDAFAICEMLKGISSQIKNSGNKK